MIKDLFRLVLCVFVETHSPYFILASLKFFNLLNTSSVLCHVRSSVCCLTHVGMCAYFAVVL